MRYHLDLFTSLFRKVYWYRCHDCGEVWSQLGRFFGPQVRKCSCGRHEAPMTREEWEACIDE